MSEDKDTQTVDQRTGNGNFTRFTYVALPPDVEIPGDHRNAMAPLLAKYDTDAADANFLLRLTYQLKTLDSVLALMPDQIQTSPELHDAEEKIDELRLHYAMLLKGDTAMSADLAFDILSEVDATTAPTWTLPGSTERRMGKIEAFLRSNGLIQR